MFLAVGIGAYVAAVFHMVTHAFFKALLFLGSGSVIHGMHGEQDMRRMGALRKAMPITAATFIIGWLAIAGVPIFAGFWSKDEILLYAYDLNPALWVIGLATALLTAYYMTRQVIMVFFGDARWNDDEAVTVAGDGDDDPADAPAIDAHATAEHAEHHEVQPHESPWLMTLPLVVLAVLATLGGGLNLPINSDTEFLAHWLHPVIGENEAHIDVATGTKYGLAAAAVAIALVGILAARAVYLRRRVKAVEPAVLAHGWYYDEAITAFVGGPGEQVFETTAAFDRNVVDGGVNGVAGLVQRTGRLLRQAQTGYVRTYALGITTGVVIVLGYFLTRLSF
jgi:NADH-quinone oxidoreductase subunit L